MGSSRSDVSPEEGVREYGGVEFAGSTSKNYLIESPEHIRVACSSINRKDTVAKCDADEVKTIKNRIKQAAQKHRVGPKRGVITRCTRRDG